MLRTRSKRQAAAAEQAKAELSVIQASIAALANEDLLDLADIFVSQSATPLAKMATAEMLKRNIAL